MDDIFVQRPEILIDDKIETLNGIEEKRDKWQTYSFNGMQVPRVTEILKECIGKDYLVGYALKCKNYYAEMDQILYIGTIVHKMIDEYLQFGDVMSPIDYTNEYVFNQTQKAYNNFVRWHQDKLFKGYKIDVVDIEKEIVCPWYGGTIDAIFNITDPEGCTRTYIVDFKTSTKIARDYLVQTYAYMYAVNWFRTNVDASKYPHIDGIGIIRVDKKRKSSEDIFIDSSNIPLMSDIHNAYVSCLNWFYHQINLDWIIKTNRG